MHLKADIVKWYNTSLPWMSREFDSPYPHKINIGTKADKRTDNFTHNPKKYLFTLETAEQLTLISHAKLFTFLNPRL